MDARRRYRVLVVLAALALVAAACGDDGDDAGNDSEVPSSDGGDAGAPGDADWEALLAAAEAEGSVTYYSTQNLPNVEALKAAFEAEYDIDMVIVRGLPTDLTPRLEAERDTGRGEADVYTTADTRWVAEKDEEGYFVEVVGPNFDSPDFDRARHLPTDTYFVSHAATIGFGWNTELVPDGLSSYEDLLDEQFAGGRIGIVEPAAEAQVDWYVYIQELYGEEFLDDLAEQSPRIYPGGTAIIEAMTSGEIYATPYASATINDTIELGAPVDWELPDTAWGAIFNTTVLESAPNPNAAQVLANFILSEAGQTAVGTNYVAVMPGIEVSLLDIDDVREQPESLTPDAISDFQERFRRLFQ